ncbi:MAG: hypothetical protein KJZ83_00375 [Burkholderiaceae bacterium]|nr:hypothetical protein [Burkholderiaceae bacterium]
MPKLQIKATELVNTDVNFVSLVKRGANRIPFRITKEDEPMLDLHKIGRTLFKKTDPKPAIVAAVIKKGADLNQVAAIFKSAGLEPKEFVKSEKDGIVTVAKADAEKAEDTVVFKVSDEVGLVISHLKKTFDSYAYSSTDFSVVMATEGVYPSMCVAKEALGTTIGNILYKAASPAEASQQVASAIDAFKDYMTMLLGSVPVQAFKADIAVAQGVEKAATGSKGKAGASEKEMDEEDDKEAGKGKARSAKDEATSEAAPTPPGDEPPVTETQKADAGKNGTGAGFELGDGTGTDPRATADDLANTAVNAVPGESTTGNPSEGPVEARKEAVAGLPDPDGFEPGDGDGFAAAPTDSQQATARASADDAANSTQNGGTTGSSIPDGDSGLGQLGGVRKEGDGDVGKKGKGNKLPDNQSGAGAQQAAGQEKDLKDVTKTDYSDVVTAIAALQKSFEGAVLEVKKEVGALSERVDRVDTLVRKADEALNGTVFNDAGGDGASVKKTESSTPPLLDTAYSRRAVA